MIFLENQSLTGGIKLVPSTKWMIDKREKQIEIAGLQDKKLFCVVVLLVSFYFHS